MRKISNISTADQPELF